MISTDELTHDTDYSLLPLEVCQALDRQLITEIQDIQTQLGDTELRPASGDHEGWRNYRAWRSKANWALTIKQKQRREIKARITQLVQSEQADKRTNSRAKELLRRAGATLFSISCDPDILRVEEIDLRDKIMDYFGDDPEFQKMIAEFVNESA